MLSHCGAIPPVGTNIEFNINNMNIQRTSSDELLHVFAKNLEDMSLLNTDSYLNTQPPKIYFNL